MPTNSFCSHMLPPICQSLTLKSNKIILQNQIVMFSPLFPSEICHMPSDNMINNSHVCEKTNLF